MITTYYYYYYHYYYYYYYDYYHYRVSMHLDAARVQILRALRTASALAHLLDKYKGTRTNTNKLNNLK